MTPRELKNSILQLAIQGRLVEQRPEEGTAAELYAQIQSEKQALIKAGKLKKEKPLPEITEDEKPFDIPESWKWVRWGDLSESIQYGFNAPALESGRIRMVRISDIQDGSVQWNTVPFCEIDEKEISTYLLKPNDILFARTGGTVGKSYLVREVPEEAIYAGYLIRTRYSSLLCPEYMKHFMGSKLYWNQLRNGTIATAQPNCNGKTLSKMILPLPPLAEQKRIVARIEEMLPLVDRYEQAWNRLEDLNKRFPGDLQKSLLQLAIQGKLVEQRPEEGTGEELYQQIQREKQALIKAGKLKKEKPLPEITEDEKPFDIPKSWKWVRIGDYVQKVTDYVASGSFASLRENVKYYKEPNYAILVKTKDFQSNFTNDLTYTDEHGYDFLENSRLFGGELIMPNIGASIGKVFKVPYLDAKMTLAPNAILVRFVHDDHLSWLSYYFLSPSGYSQLMSISSSTAQAKFSKTEFKSICFPVPPFAEQKRIVARLEELLPLCEKLK